MSTITTINSGDVVANSRSTINTNFSNLNTDKMEKSNNLSDVSNAGTARTNLGLGNSATKDVGTGSTQVAAGDHNHDATYAPIAKGVTNGDSHDHNGGDGAQISHANLSNIGTNTHAQIDSFIAKYQFIYKSADETVNNSNVLQSDDHLILPVGANEVWAFTIHLIHNSGTTPDIKFGWTVPASTTMIWDHHSGYDGGPFTESSTRMEAGFAANATISYWGTIFVSSTPGNVVLQWAQNTTNASNTKVLKGSYIIAHKLA